MDRREASVISDLAEVWASTVQACSGLAAEQWELPTDCPGWSVRDQLSHIIGIERILMGESPPEASPPWGDHVKNSMGEMNEAWVAARRSLPGDQVLAEFSAVTADRLEALSALGPDDFARVGWSPIGEVPYADFMVLRAFDSWVHEQDVRAAIGRPGGRGGAGERITLDRVVSLMPYVVGRQVKPPAGLCVAFEVEGPLPRNFAVEMGERRAEALAEVPADPNVTITVSAPDFWRLGCGRVGVDLVLADGSTRLAGDLVLGERVLGAMNFMV